MRYKFCDIDKKRTYLELCQNCRQGLKLTETVEKGMKIYDCPELFEKVTFIGPHTDKWRQRFGQGPEPPVGTIEKARYEESFSSVRSEL